MSTLYRRRLRQFREILDLRDLLPPTDPTRGVLAAWPDPSFLLKQNWQTSFDNIWYQDGGAVREWVLRREGAAGEERFAVRIFVSSYGFLPAWRYFLRVATNPTMPLEELGYERRLEGEVASLVLRAPIPGTSLHEDSLLQLYRNVVFDLRAYGTDVDVRAVAAQLQGIAEQEPDQPLAERRPGLPVQPALVADLQPGAEVKVGLPAAPDDFGSFEETDFEVRVQSRGDAIFAGFRGPEAFFRLSQAGRGKIRVQAINRRTLASREVVLNVLAK